MDLIIGLGIPFLGTTAGAACIFFLKKEMKPWMEKSLMGFAAGVMTAASIWSLLLPAIELEAGRGRFSFVPSVIGFWLGILFLLATDWMGNKILGKETVFQEQWKKNTMTSLAVTIHNIPEGLAVGAAFAGAMAAGSKGAIAGAFSLAVGVGIQNLPEGFIVAMPCRRNGNSRRRSFLYGVASGATEPIAGWIMFLLITWLSPFLPYLLAFSAGAMFYVVLEELIPDAICDSRYHLGTLGFTIGFLLMMTLDVALG